MSKLDEMDVVMAVITAIVGTFVAVVVVLVILSAAGCLPDSWWF
jgi:hypothetical protein